MLPAARAGGDGSMYFTAIFCYAGRGRQGSAQRPVAARLARLRAGSRGYLEGWLMTGPTANSNQSLPFRIAEFETLTEGLDYAARGETGCNFFSSRGQLLRAMTYGELRDEAVRMAERLVGAGLERGDRLAIVADTSPEFLTAFVACQYAGVLPVPLPLSIHIGSREAYIERLRTLIAKAGARAAVGPTEFADYLKRAAGDKLTWIATADQVMALPAGKRPLRAFGKDELCYVQFSSGSTSAPRGACISQRAITANARGIGRDGLQLRPGDRGTSWLPLYHDMGLVGFCLAPMLSQIPIDYLPTNSFALRPLVWLKLISEYGGTISFSPTFGYELCVRRGLAGLADELDLSRWRVAGIGAEMIDAGVLERFAETFGTVGFSPKAFVPSYGLAESTLAVSFALLATGAETEVTDLDHLSACGEVVAPTGNGAGPAATVRRFVVCGRPLPEHRIEIRDEAGRVLPERRVGRIVTVGPSLMSGYYRDPEATAKVMTEDGWLDTGDLGYLSGGQLVVTGRQKDLIILNGRNIWPQDVEWAVEKLAGLRAGDAACFSVETDEGERMVVMVQCRATDGEMREALSREVYATVRKVSGADGLVVLVPPRTLKFTSSGKLSRAAIKADYLAGEIVDLRAPLAGRGANGGREAAVAVERPA
jgi:fatty-acyl-CoA synthase